MLMFEGEYLNGERNGKGKEYYEDELEYEGEFLNGRRQGRGKEYDEGKLIYLHHIFFFSRNYIFI